jgi:hypothetical protein
VATASYPFNQASRKTGIKFAAMTTDKVHFLGKAGQRGQIAKRPTGDDRDVSLWAHRCTQKPVHCASGNVRATARAALIKPMCE